MQYFLDSSIRLIGNDRTAYLSWGIGCIFWVVGFLFVSQQGIDSYSSNLSRGIMLFSFNLPIILKDKTWLDTQSIKYLFIRNILIVIYGLIFAQCFFYLPINVVHTLDSSGPFFVLIIDYLINHVEITRKQMYGSIIALIGVLLTVNGHILYQIMGVQIQSEFNYLPQAQLISTQIYVIMILLFSNVLWAYAIIAVKKVKNYTPYHINFHHGYTMIMISGCLYQNTSVRQQFRVQAFLLSLLYHGLPLAIGQAFFSNALKLTQNYAITVMVGFISVILGYFINLSRYKQTLNLICLLGSSLIMLGVSRIAFKE